MRDKDVQGKTVAEAFPDRDPEGMEAQERELMTTGVPSRRVSGFRFHDGTMHQLEVLKFLVPGPAPAICSMATDVTHQREVEEQLRQSQKMKAVGQLTGGIAHDFNNLLTVILGGSETLSEALAGDPHLGRLAGMVLMAAKRGADLTANLLAYSRRQRLNPRATDVNALVRRLHDLLRRTLGEQIDIELALDAGPSFAHVDASQLEVAILNLAINSRDAMPRGGKLTIRTAGVEIGADDARADAGAKPGSYLMVSVVDTGIGMSPEILARAFDPFFTTKDVGKGTGLGLSMVSGFAKQSGGHATIDSEEERGTVVTLYLPRVANAAVPGSATANSEGTRGGNETILMVEHDAMLRAHVAKLLAGLGYRVLVAPNGAEALEILRRNPEVDLIFTDIVMPGGMDGSRLAAAAWTLRPELKVLLTTGHSNAALPDQSDPAGKIEMLNMPYRKADLAAKLRQVLDANWCGFRSMSPTIPG
ncbi:MAG: ATP-binding protein [Alphaproteobacteria bacterium]|nr:ATP-binding protein [Alphaproteobacteria bacterium]